jgi:2,3,4,5-tetrahydropyridine-2-carboxylate N-succinyltransferase
MSGDLKGIIERAWEERHSVDANTKGAIRSAVDAAISALDSGEARIAEKRGDEWVVNPWLKKAVLLSFRLNDNEIIKAGASPYIRFGTTGMWWDKVPTKTSRWTSEQFREAGFRMVPGAIVRRGAFIAPGAVLMPSFVNIGARVGENTMVDTWATVGSCAQIGSNVHISGGAGIGGVLEPLQAGPVIIEDDCFIGARSEVAEGVVVERGSVLSMGVFLGASTKIVDRASGEVHYGRVPAYSVVVPGALPGKDGGPALACAVIVKRVDERTRSKTSINELLRD